MSGSISLAPRGTTFVRCAMARALAGDGDAAAVRLAENRFGISSAEAAILRAPSAAGGLDGTWGDQLAEVRQAGDEFMELARPQTLINRMSGVRRAPPRTRISRGVGRPVAHWVGAGRPAPITEPEYGFVEIEPLRVSGNVVLTTELMRASTPAAERLVRQDLIAAVVAISDSSFIDPAAVAIPGVSPAAITVDATRFESTGDIADDVEAALEAFTGALTTAVFITHPRVAAFIGLRAGIGGVAADLGAKGGTLAGIPVLTSEAVPMSSGGGLLILVDAAAIALYDEGIAVSAARHANVEVSTTPTNPATAAAVMTSLWQRNLVALRVERGLNWTVASPGAVVMIEHVSYPSAS